MSGNPSAEDALLNTTSWDRANRLLSMGGTSYKYNGRGQRLEKTVSSTTTKYTLDLGLSLWETLVETTVTDVTRYLHTPLGLLAQQRPDASWQWALGDGLGSVRGMVNSSLAPQESRLYTPYGEPSQLSGSAQSAYGFTGEPTDSNALVYLRGRYYHPGIGQFINLDPLETANRYGYVGGNPINRVDPSGLLFGITGAGGGSGGGGTRPNNNSPVVLAGQIGGFFGGLVGSVLGTVTQSAVVGLVTGLVTGATVAGAVGYSLGGSQAVVPAAIAGGAGGAVGGVVGTLVGIATGGNVVAAAATGAVVGAVVGKATAAALAPGYNSASSPVEPKSILGKLADSEPESDEWCEDRKKEIIRILTIMSERLRQSLQDVCREWERSSNPDYPRPEGCSPTSTWGGHLGAIKQRNNSLVTTYGRFSKQNCPDPDNMINGMVNAWQTLIEFPIDSLVPEREAERTGVAQPIPPNPNDVFGSSEIISITPPVSLTTPDIFQRLEDALLIASLGFGFSAGIIGAYGTGGSGLRLRTPL